MSDERTTNRDGEPRERPGFLERIGFWLRSAEPVSGMVLGGTVGALCGGAAILFTFLIHWRSRDVKPVNNLG